MCREELLSDKYTAVRRSLYSYGSGALSHRQLIALCDVRHILAKPSGTPSIFLLPASL